MEAISREMVGIDLIDRETQKIVLDEFAPLLLQSVQSIKGGYSVALETLEAARGLMLPEVLSKQDGSVAGF